MKLWLLKAKEEFTGYIMNQNLIVRSDTEEHARFLANEEERDTSAKWLDPEYATCEELLQEGEEGIIIVDNNGA